MSLSDKDKIIIELQEQLIEDKDKQIAWLSKSCDALADEVRSLEKQVLQQKAQADIMKAQNDQWQASSEERHSKGRNAKAKAKADLVTRKNNTLRLKTTRKSKK